MKSSNSEHEIQVLRSPNSIPAIEIVFSPGFSSDNLRLRPEDLFENGHILNKIGQVMEDIYFNENMDENLAVYVQLVEAMGKYKPSILFKCYLMPSIFL